MPLRYSAPTRTRIPIHANLFHAHTFAPSSGRMGIMLNPARTVFMSHAFTKRIVTNNATKSDRDAVREIVVAASTKPVPISRFDMGPAALIRPFCSRETTPDTRVAPGAAMMDPDIAGAK